MKRTDKSIRPTEALFAQKFQPLDGLPINDFVDDPLFHGQPLGRRPVIATRFVTPDGEFSSYVGKQTHAQGTPASVVACGSEARRSRPRRARCKAAHS